jgi:catechol 2,3-dioxygenase-like lactoylglutathione lyase family enzyme
MDVVARQAALGSIAPFFIVRDLARATSYYVDRLGFQVTFRAPDDEPFFAILQRDQVRIMVKVIDAAVPPQPNHTRHPWARWDAFVHTSDPDTLSTEFTAAGVTFHRPLRDTDDGLRGFETRDDDGYVIFFGRPL